MALREILEEEFEQDVVSSIELTGVDTSKLNADLVEAMQETVWYIRQNTGSYYVLCAHNLWELRNKCRGNKKSNPRFWTEFKKSGLLPFTPREITDLIAAWEGWLSKTNLNGEHFNLMGIRTLAYVASRNQAQIKKIEALLLKGERLTEKAVKQQFMTAAEKAAIEAKKAARAAEAAKAEADSKDALASVLKLANKRRLSSKPPSQIIEEMMTLKAQAIELQKENEKLKAELAKVKVPA